MTPPDAHRRSVARRMFELVEPIGVIPYSADEPNEAMFALGFTDYWDTYFAGRAAPLGDTPAEVVDALFYNFAPGEVARHIPKVWSTTTPDAAIAARATGCVKALWRILADRVDPSTVARAGDLLTVAATSVPCEGRPMYAALRSLAIPDDAMHRLFHAASLLREHRGDGHIAALMVDGIGGLESHVLLALDMDMPAEKFGRIHHLPAAQLAAVIDGMRDRGSDRGRRLAERRGSGGQAAGRGAYRRPRGEALRRPRPRGARRADRPPRADGRSARGRPGLGVGPPPHPGPPPRATSRASGR